MKLRHFSRETAALDRIDFFTLPLTTQFGRPTSQEMGRKRVVSNAIKLYAYYYAKSARPLPLDWEAQAWLLAHVRVRYGGRPVPAADDQYFLDELGSMVEAHRRRLAVEAAVGVIHSR